ncbi:MAG: hypothetical protein HRJ53_08865 [Acidobacteria bacterium Pan2503]|uniref:Uncharacterized protein n=1 Tax=Candidatus Acidiferrum panamense TaxID=2741543 RepID=A0A7V8SWM3_9BACT|nr:hypothetical protein [Candidatus Acidoferrum panamensis]
MKAMENETLAAILQIALRTLSIRLLTLVSLLLNAGMFGWAMWAGGYDRLAVAGAFAAATWTLIHFRREQ